MIIHYPHLFLTYRPGFKFHVCHKGQATAIPLSLFSHLWKGKDNAGQVVFVGNHHPTDPLITCPFLPRLKLRNYIFLDSLGSWVLVGEALGQVLKVGEKGRWFCFWQKLWHPLLHSWKVGSRAFTRVVMPPARSAAVQIEEGHLKGRNSFWFLDNHPFSPCIPPVQGQ